MILFLEEEKIYYPQVFLEESKYIIKEKMIHNYIDDVEISSDFLRKSSDGKNSCFEEKSDEETFKLIEMEKNSDEEDSDKENFDEENLNISKIG